MASFKLIRQLSVCFQSKRKFAILVWNSNHFNLVFVTKKINQVHCIRDIILARGHINKYKHACFDLNLSSFTSLHFQVVLLALWSLLPFEQQVPLYWIDKNPPGEGFGSSSLCSIVGTYLITTYMLVLTNITLTQNKLLQANTRLPVYF